MNFLFNRFFFSFTDDVDDNAWLQRDHYRLRVRASDKGVPPSYADVEVELDVVDRNNKPPIWDKSIYGPIYSKENVMVGTKVASIKARLVFKYTKIPLTYLTGCGIVPIRITPVTYLVTSWVSLLKIPLLIEFLLMGYVQKSITQLTNNCFLLLWQLPRRFWCAWWWSNLYLINIFASRDS